MNVCRIFQALDVNDILKIRALEIRAMISVAKMAELAMSSRIRLTATVHRSIMARIVK